MLKIRISFLALFITAATSGFSQKIKIGLKTGQKYKVQTNEKMTLASEMMGTTFETGVDSKTNTEYEVTEIDKDGIHLIATITKMEFHVTDMGEEMNFDSEKKDTSGSITSKPPGIKKQRRIIINDKGIITSQDRVEEKMQFSLLGHEGDDNKESIDLFIPAFIGRELKAGDSFADSNSYKKEKTSYHDSGTYTIKKVENGIAVISYTGTGIFSMIMDTNGKETNGISTNNISSEIKVDLKTGIILEKTSVIESIINTILEGKTIPSTTKSVETVKVSDK